jgi:hypothetical protein
MTIEATIQSVLGALVTGRCYPMIAPDKTVKPYVVYQVISNVPEVTLDGVTDTENRRVQVDIYDRSYGAVKTLELAVKAAMEAATFINIPLSSRETYETDTQLYRVSIDYSIWT